MRKTKIVCTIGPASDSLETLIQLIHSGMNVARLNFSHGTHEEHKTRIEKIRMAAKQTGKTIAIVLDIKGPKIRTHEFAGGQATLVEGTAVTISMDKITGTAERFSVTYKQLYGDVEVGSHLLLDDGLIELEVVEKANQELKTKVIHGGIIKNHKGINVPNVKIRLPGVTGKDIQDIVFGIGQDVDYIAASFVRKADDILDVQHILSEHKATHIGIIAKIENQEGIDNINEIVEAADAIMVARGDMGVEIEAEEVPLIQKTLINTCNKAGKPVITATQMLDSMQRNPRPTRAEASDVANAILDGTDAIMLSGETAAGLYPVQAVQMMCKIATRVEQSSQYKELQRKQVQQQRATITEAIGYSVANTALVLDAAAILAWTQSGYTAKVIAKCRPQAPIIAITCDEYIVRQLALVWGIHALSGNAATSTDDMLERAAQTAQDANLITIDDTVIITAGIPIRETGTTNLMKVHVIK